MNYHEVISLTAIIVSELLSFTKMQNYAIFVVFALCGRWDIIFCRLCSVWEWGYHFLSSLHCVGVGILFFVVFALFGSWDITFVVFSPWGSWDIFFCRLCTVRELGYQFLSSLHCVEGGISFFVVFALCGSWDIIFVVFALCGSWDIILCRLCPVWELGYHFVSSLHCVGVGISFCVVFALFGSWDAVFRRLYPVWKLAYCFPDYKWGCFWLDMAGQSNRKPEVKLWLYSMKRRWFATTWWGTDTY